MHQWWPCVNATAFPSAPPALNTRIGHSTSSIASPLDTSPPNDALSCAMSLAVNVPSWLPSSICTPPGMALTSFDSGPVDPSMSRLAAMMSCIDGGDSDGT